MENKVEVSIGLFGFVFWLFFIFWLQSGWYRIQPACDLIASEYKQRAKP